MGGLSPRLFMSPVKPSQSSYLFLNLNTQADQKATASKRQPPVAGTLQRSSMSFWKSLSNDLICGLGMSTLLVFLA